MLASSNTDQISSFPFMNQSTPIEKSIQIHDENHDQNPMSRLFEQQNHPPSLQLIDCYTNYNYNNCNFNPFLDDDQEFILGHILYSQKQQLLGNSNFFGPEIALIETTNNTNNEATTTTRNSSQNKAKTNHTSPKKPISKKRSSNGMKKDRHSKICTSKGPRDRRMRLSLEIARNFFDLQDMLGFDKASKTVEWLFTKSRSAIKELKEKYLSEASCDSSLVRKFSVYNDKKVLPSEKKRRRLRIVDKESRYKARARARERTRAKSIRRGLEISKTDFEGNPDGVCEMGDVIEEMGSSKRKITHGSLCENEKVLGSNGKNSASLISNDCEDERVSKETCSDKIHLLPGSSMDLWPTCSWIP